MFIMVARQIARALPAALKMPILLLFTALSYKMHDEKKH